jgi:hypothetical protein
MRTRLLLWAFLVVPLSACTTSAPSTSTGKAPAVSGSFFSLSTGNVERLAAWYSDNLGFSIDRKGVTSSGVSFAVLSRTEALIEILQLPASKPRDAWGLPPEPEAVHGILKVGLLVKDLDALYSRAQARQLNVFFPPVQPPDVPMRTFGLKDPDGNIVQFFGP